MMNNLDSMRPSILLKDGRTIYPTNFEYLIAFSIAGCQWAIDALPEAEINNKLHVEKMELQKCETYNGGCI